MEEYRDLFSLSGKVAVITGGAGGIGRHLALGLAQYGADVVVFDLRCDRIKNLIKDFDKINKRLILIECDVSDEKSVLNSFKQVESEFGHLDILINAAAINKLDVSLNYSVEDWDKVMAINLKGTFLCSREAARLMKTQNNGKIVNFGSVASIMGHPEHSAYAASKGGVLMLTRVMAVELSKYNINVNAIGPACTLTEVNKAFFEIQSNYDNIVKNIPMNRLGRPSDIVGAVIFLCSSASDFVNGTIIMVDGGRTAN